MNKAAIAISVFVGLISSASVAAELPPRLLGRWCFDMDRTETSKLYVRGSESECEYGEVVVGPDSYEEIKVMTTLPVKQLALPSQAIGKTMISIQYDIAVRVIVEG
jgi:hypothetical protein